MNNKEKTSIKDRKLTEQIKLEKEFTEIALDAQLDTFFLFEIETGKAIRWNKAFREITGYTDEEIAGLPAPGSYYSPEDLVRAGVFVQKVIKEGSGTIELELICKDGRKIPTEYRVSVINDENDEPKYAISIGRDIMDRNQIEEELRESEERFRGLSEAAFDAIFISEKGICIEQNSTAEKMFGYTHKEAVGRMGTEWIIPEDREMVMNNMLRGFEEPYGATALRKDGTTFPAEIQGRMMHYRGRQVRVTALKDITSRKNAEMLLKESEEKYRLLATNTMDTIWVSDLEFNIQYVNDAIFNLLGYTPNELLAMKPTDYMAPEVIAALKKTVSQLMLENKEKKIEQYTFEIQQIHKNGTTIDVEITGNPLLDKDGNLHGFQGRSVDTTQRKRAEEKLKQLSNLVEQSTEGMALADLNGDIIFSNMAWCNMHGYKNPDDYQGKNLKIFHNREQLMNEVIPFNEKVLKHGTYSGEIGHITKNGDIFPTLMTTTLLKDQKGNSFALAGIARDITELKQSEQQILEAKDKAERYLDMAGSIILSLNPKGEILLINQKGQEILEYSSEELIGKNWFDICIPKEINNEIKNVFQKILNGDLELVEHYENDVVTKSGKHKTISWYNSYITNSEGEIEYLLSSGIDVSEMKKVHLEIQENEKLLRKIAESYPNSYLSIIEKDLTISFSSGQEFANQNLDPIDFLGLHLEDVFGEKTPIIKEKYLRTFRGEECKFELYMNNQYQLYKTVPLRDEKDQINRILVVVENVTERKKTEIALQESEKRYKDFISHSSEGIYRIEMKNPVAIDLPKAKLIKKINQNAIIAEVNFALADMYGLKPEDMIDKLAVTVAPNYGERASLVLKQKNYQVRNIETEDIDKDGNPVYLSETYHGEIENGKLIRIWGVQRNITEKRIAEQALMESESRFRQLFESSRDGNMTLEGPDWKFTSANKAVVELFGVKNIEEFMRYAPWQLSPPQQPDGKDSKEKAKEMIGQALEKGSNYFEWTHRKASGEDFYATVLLNRIDLDDSQILLATVRDITEKKTARIALEESRQRLELALTGANLGLWDVDFRTNTVYRSEEYATMLDYKLNEIENTNEFWLSLIHPEDLKDVIYIRKSHEKLTDEYFQSEQRLRCKDGTYKWVLNWGRITDRDEMGNPVRAVGIHMDIDERKKAEEDLVKTMSRLQATLESTADGILVVDLEGRIVDYNQKFTEIWEISDDVLPEGKTRDLVSPENAEYAMKHIIGQLVDPNGFIAKVQELYSNPEAESFDILTFKDNRIVERYSKPQYINDDPVGRVWSFRDVTERQEAEKHIRESELLNRTVIAGSPVGISVRDTKGTLVLANEAWKKLWGLSDQAVKEYMKPRKKLEFNEKDSYLGKHVLQVKDIYTRGGSYSIPEIKLKKPANNKAEWISQVFYALKNEKDEVDRVVIQTEDITQRKKAEEELIKHRDHLEELVKERTAELEKKNMDLEKYNKLFVGREFRIKELRNRIAELEEKLKE